MKRRRYLDREYYQQRIRAKKLKAQGTCINCAKFPIANLGGEHCRICLDKRKQWLSSSKEAQHRRNVEYYTKNRECMQARAVENRRIAREAVLLAYGSMCQCCSESVPEFLTIDHIDGWEESVDVYKAPRAGPSLYSWLVRNKFPLGFQLLCYNCNCAKGRYGQCPHQRFSLSGLMETA